MECPQPLLTVCRVQVAAAGSVLRPGSSGMYSKPEGQLLLNPVCQLPGWLMVRGGQWPSSLVVPSPQSLTNRRPFQEF